MQRPGPHIPSKNYLHWILSFLEFPGIETAMTGAAAHKKINSSISTGDGTGSIQGLDGWPYAELRHKFGGGSAVGHFSRIPRTRHRGLQQSTGGSKYKQEYWSQRIVWVAELG